MGSRSTADRILIAINIFCALVAILAYFIE